MDEIFINMDIQKRDRIINSALEEFSKNRYEKASTNTIVKNAKISKGLLFHYFKSKKELFEKLEKFSVETVVKRIDEKTDWNMSDFFSRVKQAVIIKIGIVTQYPHIYDFMLLAFEGKNVSALHEYRERIAPGLLERIYTHNIDFSKFRDNIDMERTMSIIKWTFEKYAEETFYSLLKTKEPINFHKLEDEFEKYIVILKEAFYK